MKKIDLDEDLLAVNSGEIIVYNFDCISREYLSTTTETMAVGVGLPANSCIDAPLDKKMAWLFAELKTFSLGSIFSIIEARTFTITELGEYLKSVTPKKPASQYDKWNSDS
ncbi:hypothetical protein [Pantoea sp. SJZ147]|uniref:hypothetical protein n=1 Tax=Pantoea sp. SJZ147 TaxID=2572896 RepID=UPI0011A1E7C0|nr:hypothetical protein [Pantoea sp. SJZ147]TWD33759.1 hypothetical protein FBY13_11533 [Pantoea sp. SJZ147]